MAKNTRNLYLYLALVCFAGILAIFVADGYLGVYDTVYITFGEHEQKIEAYSWREPWVKEQGYGIGTSWGEPVYFKYKIANRTFATYQANVKASVWKSGEQILQLSDESISILPFKEVAVNWKLLSEDLGEVGPTVGESREYTARIWLGGVERKVILSYYTGVPGYPEKGSPQAIPAPEPVR